jgi:putative methyltransferase (TIGR04325 family)
MEKILKQICPPFLWSTLKKLRPRYGFFGVYSKFSEVTFDNPWISLSWISSQKQKLLNGESGNKQLFFPLPHLTGYSVILCFLVNLLSQKKPIRVLDHHGGTGVTYHMMHPYLLFPENVEWSVLDSPPLLRIGKDFLNRCVNEGRGKVNFISDLPNSSSEKFDVVYVNTAVQYYPDYQKTIGDLLKFKPKYFVFTRLLSGEGKTFVCMQKVLDKQTPCRFINSREFVEYFKENGYDLILKEPNKQELLGEGSIDFREFKDIPKEYQIPFSINLVFEKMV